jgi:hypothetical protein
MKGREYICQMNHYQDLKIFYVQHKLLDAKHEVLYWNEHVFYEGETCFPKEKWKFCEIRTAETNFYYL